MTTRDVRVPAVVACAEPGDSRQSGQIAGQLATNDQTRKSRDHALQQVDHEDGNAGHGTRGERHIGRPSVASAHRSGVRAARQTGCDQRRWDTSEEVARDDRKCW